jgi:hypothetical protein
MGRRFLFFREFLMTGQGKHHELIENRVASQRREPKSPSLQQRRNVVVPLYRTPSGLHQTPNSDVLTNIKPSSSESETRPLVFGI